MASSSPQRGGANPLGGRSSSPALAFPSSSSPRLGNNASTSHRHDTFHQAPASAAQAPAQSGAIDRSSSPLAFPSSSPRAPRSSQATPRGNARQQPLFAPGSAQRAPPSSATGSARLRSIRASSEVDGNRHAGAPSSEPLFFPSSVTPRSRRGRGDIHSSIAISPATPSRRRNGVDGESHAPASSAGAVPVNRSPQSAGSRLDTIAPSISNAALSSDAVEQAERAQGARTVIWNTAVSVDDTMFAFRALLQDFKQKYRNEYARKLGKPIRDTNEPNKLVYEHYLRKMRTTRQTNLNLDLQDLEAFPPTKKLASWIRTYPQEVVPICDQVLKDCLIDVAEKDHNANPASVTDADFNAIESSSYKIRPFGTYEVPKAVERTGSLRMSRDERSLGINMRELNPQDIDKLVTVKGLVIRCTPIIPDMKVAFFRCLNCAHTMTIEVDRGRIEEPDRCPREQCNLQGSMAIIHNRCEFADRQVIRLQETPDVVPDGQTPHTVSLCVYDELVDLAKPGDRVVVTGIFRSVPVRINPKQRVIKSLFKTFVDTLHIRKTDKKRMGLDTSTREAAGQNKEHTIGVGPDEEDDEAAAQISFLDDNLGSADDTGMDLDSEDPFADETLAPPRRAPAPKRTLAEQEEKLVELSRRSDIYDTLARSLAPSIWEMDDVKKGILLQLFGGTNKSIARGGGSGGPRYRGDINVLLVGDPGTSKSQILQYVHKIAPRGVYTSGKGSSAVGLTAYVTRDPDSKQLVLESGALVLSDGGVCCIDEFDKMSDATRSVLHEVMEQQTVSIAKAGIITTLNARTSILAAANPVGSKYNLKWPITRNIDLPPTLISRFDLLYLVLDKIDESNDRRLAKHLVSLYLEDRPDTGGHDILPIETLTAYISYARTHVHPEITAPAGDALVKAYVAMRSAGIDARGGSERRITATTRQLESMIRLSEAHARMRYSDKVELSDVEEASRLIREALKESATDPVTGLIDLDLLNTGQGMQQRKMHGDLRREVLAILEKVGTDKGIRWTEVAKTLNDQSSIPIEPAELASVIKALEQEGQLAVRGTHDKRTLRKLVS